VTDEAQPPRAGDFPDSPKSLLHRCGEGGTTQSVVTDEARPPRAEDFPDSPKSLLHCCGEGGTTQSVVTDEARPPRAEDFLDSPKSLLHRCGEGGTTQSVVTDEARPPRAADFTNSYKLYSKPRISNEISYTVRLHSITEGEGLIRLGSIDRIVSLIKRHAEPPSPMRWRRLGVQQMLKAHQRRLTQRG